MKVFEICNCDYQIELKYKNNLALIIVNDNQKPKNKYAIVKIGEQSQNLILQTNSKDEVMLWLDLRGVKIGEKLVFIDDNTDPKLNIICEVFILKKYNT